MHESDEAGLFPPHLGTTAIGEADEGVVAPEGYPAILESICGAADDSQAVEQYDGTLGVTARS